MTTSSEIQSSYQNAVPSTPEPAPVEQVFSDSEYLQAYGESLNSTLDLNTWQPGTNLIEMYDRLKREVAEAVIQENKIQNQIREKIFPQLKRRPGAPPGAGVYKTTPEHLRDVHQKILFNGGVEACDGTVVSHDTLPVTITQIGVCLVSYKGDQGSWAHRIFRRDLRETGKNPVDETLDILERRSSRSGLDQDNAKDKLSNLARRGIMAFAERAVLMDKSDAVWRMGHGNPTPYELITGSGMPELLRESLVLLRRMILDHKRFVFVPSAPSAREFLTIGNALMPLEYAIIDTNESNLAKIAAGHYRGEAWSDLKTQVDNFVKDCGPRIAVGLFRTSEHAPCQMFFSHIDHVHEAALIAMADSVLQEFRGFPMLIDLADGLCTTTFGADIFAMSTQLAYAEAGQPFRYMSERNTRR
jgi:hypothetical protein